MEANDTAEALATNTSTTTSTAYSEEDLNTSCSDSDTTIELSNGNAKITGEGASYTDGNIVITKAGIYVFSGELTDRSLRMWATKTWYTSFSTA